MKFPIPTENETKEEYAKRCSDIAEMYWSVLRVKNDEHPIEYSNEF